MSDNERAHHGTEAGDRVQEGEDSPATGGCGRKARIARPIKTEFRAFQASRRGGEIICRLAQNRVELEGSCVFYLEGEATI